MTKSHVLRSTNKCHQFIQLCKDFVHNNNNMLRVLYHSKPLAFQKCAFETVQTI